MKMLLFCNRADTASLSVYSKEWETRQGILLLFCTCVLGSEITNATFNIKSKARKGDGQIYAVVLGPDGCVLSPLQYKRR